MPHPLLLSLLPQAADASTPADSLLARSASDASAIVDFLLAPSTLQSLGTIVFIVLLTIVASRVITALINRWKRSVQDLPAQDPKRQRVLTLGNLLASTARYVIYPIALIMVLSEVGVDVGALIATAGIAGLAIGFGAQTLVKDVIAGIFLLFDDTIHVGDLVRIGSDTGTVEDIGVRLIKVRKFNGELLMVPAGELRIFGNQSIDFARVIVPVDLSYEQDTDSVIALMEQVANEWAADQNDDILLEEAPTVQAITDFGASSVTARIVMQVRPGEQFAAERELRRRLKRVFDEHGAEIPFSRQTVYVREESDTPPRSVALPDAGASGDGVEGSD